MKRLLKRPRKAAAAALHLRKAGDGIWVADGASRMTVIRLRSGALFIHAPGRLTSQLRRDIVSLGEPRWIVAPDRLDASWVPERHGAFRGATVYLTPRVIAQAGKRIAFDYRELRDARGYPWDAEIDTLPIRDAGEFEFMHRASRTLLANEFAATAEVAQPSLWSRLFGWLRGEPRRGPHRHDVPRRLSLAPLLRKQPRDRRP